MSNLCPCPPGSMLWEGKTPKPGSRALGHGYKDESYMRDIHCVEFSTRAGRKHGDYFVVSEPGEAEYYIVSFDVEAPPGSFKKEYSMVREEALWLLCAKPPEYYRSTYVCRSRVSVELVYNTVIDIFGDSLRRIALCPVKPSSLEHRLKVEKLLDNARAELLRRVEEALERCRRWTRRAKSRFMGRVRRLRMVDASLADIIESKLSECFGYTNHGKSTRGSSMAGLPGIYRDVRRVGSPHELQG
jgi:hypothetical protein